MPEFKKARVARRSSSATAGRSPPTRGDYQDAPRRSLNQKNRGRLRDPLSPGASPRPPRSRTRRRSPQTKSDTAARPALPLRPRRVNMHEARLGKKQIERCCDDHHRRQRRPTRDHRRNGRLHGVVGLLGGVPVWPSSRGLSNVRMFAGDKATGTVGLVAKVFLHAAHQLCTAYFYRNILVKVPKSECAPARQC